LLSNFQEISSSFEPPEGKKKEEAKNDFLPLFFDTQEVVLGDSNFGGENGHQIQKFHLGWKVDIQNFPTIPLFPHLDTWKFLKIFSKGALRIQNQGATHQAIFTEMHLQLSKMQF